MRLKWNDLRESDVEEIEQFVCTEEPELLDDREITDELDFVWELEAQEGVRSISFPLPRDEHVLVGRDEIGVATVSWWCEIGGPSRVKLLVMAAALRLRGTNARVGDQMMVETLSRLLERVDGSSDLTCVTAFGMVHRRNEDSRKLLQRHGFFFVRDDGVNQEWWVRLDLPEVEATDPVG